MSARRFLRITLRFTDKRPDEMYRVASIGLDDGRLHLTTPSGEVFNFSVDDVFSVSTELGLLTGNT